MVHVFGGPPGSHAIHWDFSFREGSLNTAGMTYFSWVLLEGLSVYWLDATISFWNIRGGTICHQLSKMCCVWHIYQSAIKCADGILYSYNFTDHPASPKQACQEC